MTKRADNTVFLALRAERGARYGAIIEKTGGAVSAKLAPLIRSIGRTFASPVGIGDYIARWQTARTLSTVEGYDTAMARLDEKRAELAAALQGAFNASTFDAAAQRGLTAGAEGALAGAAAGLPLGPAGAAIGAAVGFLAGFVSGIWPFEKQASIDTWRSIAKGFSPVERYMLIPMLRQLSDEAMIRQARAPWPAWRIGDPGFPLGHTLFEGEDVLVLFGLEILLEHDAFVADSDPRARAYCLAVLASYHENEMPLRDARHIRGLAESGKLGAYATALFNENRDRTCGELRADALRLGISDYANQPDTPALQAALTARLSEYER